MSSTLPIPPIQAESNVDVKESCNCLCCFGFGKKKKPNVQQTKEIDEIDIKITHVRSDSSASTASTKE